MGSSAEEAAVCEAAVCDLASSKVVVATDDVAVSCLEIPNFEAVAAVPAAQLEGRSEGLSREHPGIEVNVSSVPWESRVFFSELPERSIVAKDRISVEAAERGCDGLPVAEELRGAVRGPGNHGAGINSPRL